MKISLNHLFHFLHNIEYQFLQFSHFKLLFGPLDMSWLKAILYTSPQEGQGLTSLYCLIFHYQGTKRSATMILRAFHETVAFLYLFNYLFRSRRQMSLWWPVCFNYIKQVAYWLLRLQMVFLLAKSSLF
jgi:hypothetical protein